MEISVYFCGGLWGAAIDVPRAGGTDVIAVNGGGVWEVIGEVIRGMLILREDESTEKI